VDENIHKKIISELQNKGEIDGMKISFRGPDNDMNYYLLYSKMISIKNKFKSINLLVDINKLKKAELEIKRLNTAIEKSASSFIITNSNAEIIYVNEYFTKLTGYSPDEVLGKTPKILNSGFHSETFYKELWDTINQGKIWKGDFYNKKKNGDLYLETATIAPIFDEGGDKIINFVSNKQDITKSMLQMAALRQSEQKLTEMNATKDKFFSIVGHDLMNPFNALLGFSNLLTEALKMKDMEDALKYSVIIKQSSQIILNLLHDLLIWSKAQSGKIKYNPALIHISDLINVTLSLLMPGAQNKKITLQTDVEENIKAFIDYNMISSVIRNLVDNALKFTNQAGNIKITAKINNGALCITVSDNGIGIDENQISNLFQIDKSYTTKGTKHERGSGLGLIISKEFIDIHKGKIWAESTPGKGSDFHFTIPVGLDTEIEQSVDRR
jgi:PAS domain S-box-containing protein